MKNTKQLLPVYRKQVQKLNQQLSESLERGDIDDVILMDYYELLLQMCLKDVRSGFFSTPQAYIKGGIYVNTFIVDEILLKNKEYLLENSSMENNSME